MVQPGLGLDPLAAFAATAEADTHPESHPTPHCSVQRMAGPAHYPLMRVTTDEKENDVPFFPRSTHLPAALV
jgi:hypothetical protein